MVDVPVPRPGPREVLVKTAGIGVNFADLRVRSGGYVHQPPLPLTPGFEASGYVAAVGQGALDVAADPDALAVGTPVVAGDAREAYAEYAVAPADLVFALPRGKSLAAAAAWPVNYTTAWCALHLRGGLEPGQTVLVHAAAGGVGSAAVQLAKRHGAVVVATASSAAKLEHAVAAGADHVINYVDEDFVSAARRLLGAEHPVDLVVDSVGGETFTNSLDLIRPWGRLVSFGQSADTPAVIDAYRAGIPRHLDIRFFARGSLTSSTAPRDRAILQDAMRALLHLWEEGGFDPATVTTLPLEEAAEAHRRLSDRGHLGKFVLDPEA
jgi:NADPH2:quinone reductase